MTTRRNVRLRNVTRTGWQDACFSQDSTVSRNRHSECLGQFVALRKMFASRDACLTQHIYHFDHLFADQLFAVAPSI